MNMEFIALCPSKMTFANGYTALLWFAPNKC